MVYKRRVLRSLWSILVYKGDPDDPKTKTKRVTAVAWNKVDAIRMAGGPVALPPERVSFVTWPETDGGPIYEICETAGPTNKKVKPSIAIPDDWDF